VGQLVEALVAEERAADHEQRQHQPRQEPADEEGRRDDDRLVERRALGHRPHHRQLAIGADPRDLLGVEREIVAQDPGGLLGRDLGQGRDVVEDRRDVVEERQQAGGHRAGSVAAWRHAANCRRPRGRLRHARLVVCRRVPRHPRRGRQRRLQAATRVDLPADLRAGLRRRLARQPPARRPPGYDDQRQLRHRPDPLWREPALRPRRRCRVAPGHGHDRRRARGRAQGDVGPPGRQGRATRGRRAPDRGELRRHPGQTRRPGRPRAAPGPDRDRVRRPEHHRVRHGRGSRAHPRPRRRQLSLPPRPRQGRRPWPPTRARPASTASTAGTASPTPTPS
jgi:hypothetical protein